MYFALTRNRRPFKHLTRNPRCSVAIDMDERPLMGMRSNLAKAVIITGDAELAEVGSGKMVRIEAGPWQGEYSPEQAVAMIASRSPLSTRDGALGFTRESYRELFARPDIQESQIFRDNEGRVLTKLIPKKIQAWDFSKAPIGNVSNQ